MSNVADYIAELIVSQLESRDPSEIPDGVSLDDLLRISFENQIESLVLRALIRLDSTKEQKKAFQNILIQRFILSSQQREELRKIQEIFERECVRNHPMKGAVLQDYYPCPELRQMSDIDILVDEESMSQVHHILGGLGYEFLSKESHHDTFIKKPYLRIEVHRSLYDGNVDKEQYNYFGTFKRSLKVDGKDFSYRYSNEDFYIYMMAHMAKHFYKMGCGVRNLIDIYVFMKRFKGSLDEDYIKTQLENNGILIFSEHMENLAFSWLTGKKRDKLYDDLIEYMLNSGIYGRDENGIWNKFAKEKVVNSKTSKFKLMVWYYFPPLYYMKDYYPWLRNMPWLLAPTWFIRGFSGVFLNKGRHKRELLRNADNEQIGIIQRIYREMKLDFQINEDH